MLQNLYKRLEDIGGGYIPSSPGWTFYGGMRRVDKNVWHLATLGTLTVYPYGAPSVAFMLPPTLTNVDGTLTPYGNYVTFTARGSSIKLDSGENDRATLSYKLTINGSTVKDYTVYWDDVTDGNIANKYGGPLTFLIPGTHNPNDTYVLYVKLANAISAYEVSRTFQGLQSIVRFLSNGNIEFYGAVTFLGQVTLPDGTTVNPS